MALPATQARASFIGNGSTGWYPWTWLIDNASDLHVAVLAPPNPLGPLQYPVTLQLGVDYNIQTPVLQVGSSAGGYIVLTGTGFFAFSGGILPGGWGIVLRRSVAFDQPAVLGNQGAFDPASIEDALDYLGMQTQQLLDLCAHAIQLPADDFAVAQQNVGLANQRANSYLAFDDNGNPYTTRSRIHDVPANGATVAGVPAVDLSNLAEGLSDLVNQTLPLTSTNGIIYSWNSTYGIYAGMLATVIWPFTSTTTGPAITTNAYYQLPNPPQSLTNNIVNKDGSALTVGQLVAGTASLLFYDGTKWRILA